MDDLRHEALRPFPVVLTLPVAWGEMDAFQHVNNTVYFRYFESARIVYFEQIGWFALAEQTGIGPILATTRCAFKFPLTYPDTVTVGAKVIQLDVDRLSMRYRVVSQRHQRLAAEGDGVVVSYNYRTQQKAPLPDAIRQRTAELELPYPVLSD